MKEHRHIGAYGLIIDNDEILLIKKKTGPYDGKLDLPGGTIEMNEKPSEALIRELKEEVGISVLDFKLFDVDSVSVKWDCHNEIINVHHIGIFYKVLNYDGDIIKDNIIDDVNDDSMGASFYKINELSKDNLSKIAIMELEKLGYVLK